jgi:chromosomal replication initiation ATPase DnaA
MVTMLCRRYGGFKLRDIADAFGIARHTTIASANSRCGEKARQNCDLARAIDSLQKQIHKLRSA